MASSDSVQFNPKDNSSVSKRLQRVNGTIIAWLFFNVIWRVLIVFWRRLRSPAAPGPQQLSLVIDPARIASRWGVLVEPYYLSDELRTQSALGLNDWQLQQLSPTDGRDIRRTIIYWAGGAYVHPTTRQHIDMMSKFAVELDARVVAMPYELAPHAVAALNFPRYVRIYEEVAKDARARGHEIILAGDSAGGGIAAAMIRAITELLPELNGHSSTVQDVLVDQLLLITPWLDASVSQLDEAPFKQLQKRDYWLDGSKLRDCSRQYAGTEQAYTKAIARLPASLVGYLPSHGQINHPYISPLLDHTHFALLSEYDIRVTLVSGTRDILYLEALKYVKNLETFNISAHYIEGVDGIHTYPLFQYLGLSECKTVTQWMAEAVKGFSRV